MMSKKLLATAIAGLALTGASTQVMASGSTYVHCKGVALKGLNACGVKSSKTNKGHHCSGKAKTDFAPEEWVKTATQKDCDTIKNVIKKNPAVKKYLQDISKMANS